MCIRQIHECNQLHRYILCVVVVIVCNEHWEQGIQIELTCNTKIVSEYDQEIPQSQTADNPVAPRGRAAQPSQDTRKTN